MFDRMKNAWSLAKSSWRVLQHDRELAWLPVIATAAALALAALFFGPVLAMLGGGGEDNAIPITGYVLVFLGYVAVSTIIYLGRAAIVHGANVRMDGGDPTLATSLRGASGHWPAVVGFAFIATTVGLILNALEEQGGIVGSIASFIGGAAWRLVTYLVLPVVVIEGAGTIEGIKGSSALVKRTWGEQVTANVGFGLLGFALTAPAIALAVALGGLGTAVAVVAIGVAAVWAVTVFSVTSALEAIFQTALYRQATGRSIPSEFDAAQLTGVITRR
jgi:Family of unknown function (DUF6159)